MYMKTERYMEQNSPIWNKELDSLAFRKLGLSHLRFEYKLSLALAGLSVLTSLFLILIACLCCCNGEGPKKKEKKPEPFSPIARAHRQMSYESPLRGSTTKRKDTKKTKAE